LDRLKSLLRKQRSVHWWVSVALIAFGLMMLAALSIQGYRSQLLIEHTYWVTLLQSVSADHAARLRDGASPTLPSQGIVRSWYVIPGSRSADVPEHLVGLPPGKYSTEAGFGVFEPRDEFEGRGSFHALVVDLPPGRLITAVDIEELERQQNHDVRVSAAWAIGLIALIGCSIWWLHANLVRPVRDLADRMRALDPGDSAARLPTSYLREEIRVIAQASNGHLERVARFIERERGLLDQASHEFRTPIAVIAGGIDVLRQMPLPDASRPALVRISNAVEDLSETMVALLFLAREPDRTVHAEEVTVLHELLPRLTQDHQHLLRGKAAQLRIGELEPSVVAVPEAMVRIAVSNLVRNAIESTDSGYVEISLRDGVICVADSGSGFDPAEAARRYRDSLIHDAPIRGQGLGLFLIGRICERFGWKLVIDAPPEGGTCAKLDVNASRLAL
jgi:signal transduction histidine kinase